MLVTLKDLEAYTTPYKKVKTYNEISDLDNLNPGTYLLGLQKREGVFSASLSSSFLTCFFLLIVSGKKKLSGIP